MNNIRKSDENDVNEYSLADISKKIITLRSYLELSQADFSAPLGLSPTHIARFEKGASVPTLKTIRMICEVFEVDKRYFETQIRVEDAVERKNPKSDVADRLEAARQERALSQLELSRISGVGQSIINRVEFGAKLTMKQGVKLAEALEVGIDWLMTGDESRKSYPVDSKMIEWLWQHESERKRIRELMKEK